MYIKSIIPRSNFNSTFIFTKEIENRNKASVKFKIT